MSLPRAAVKGPLTGGEEAREGGTPLVPAEGGTEGAGGGRRGPEGAALPSAPGGRGGPGEEASWRGVVEAARGWAGDGGEEERRRGWGVVTARAWSRRLLAAWLSPPVGSLWMGRKCASSSFRSDCAAARRVELHEKGGKGGAKQETKNKNPRKEGK